MNMLEEKYENTIKSLSADYETKVIETYLFFHFEKKNKVELTFRLADCKRSPMRKKKYSRKSIKSKRNNSLARIESKMRN